MIEWCTHLDACLFVFVNSHHSPFFDAVFFIITLFGSGWVAVPLVAAVIAAVSPRAVLARALLCAVMAGVLAGSANTGIKKAVQRPRPVIYFEEGLEQKGKNIVAGSTAEHVHSVGKVLRRNSFPSGHAATAFAAAGILAMLYGGYFFLGFIPALLVAYSRVYMGVHFPADVAGGAVLGIAAAVLTVMLFRGMKCLPEPAGLRRSHA